MTIEKHKFTTVGELKKFIDNIPDDTEISIDNVGNTGFCDIIELELQTFEYGKKDLYLNVGAESGYY